MVALLLTQVAPLPARAGNETGLDLYFFSQHDGGGQPYRNEGMYYGGLRLAIDHALTPALGIGFDAGLSMIDNAAPAVLPAPIDRALTTQGSPLIITLDTQLIFRYHPPTAPWTLVAGPYYHHQRHFISLGLDAQVDLSLAGGDTTLALGTSERIAWTKPHRFDGLWGPYDTLWSHNVTAAWTQNLTPEWLISLGGQVTVQRGPLSDQFNYVVLYDDEDHPVSLGHEQLPRERDRWQLNLRTRVSPALGVSLGLDASGYTDTWKLLHGALEPSVEFPLATDFRLRLWYRFVAQSGARYVHLHPLTNVAEQTQDADLATWTMHSPGFIFHFPMGGSSPRWVGRVTGFAFFRSDGISALGADFGFSAQW